MDHGNMSFSRKLLYKKLHNFIIKISLTYKSMIALYGYNYNQNLLLPFFVLLCFSSGWYLGMATGGFATRMVLGLLWQHWRPVEETTLIVLHYTKLVNFCCQNNYLMVGGEKVTYHAKTRYGHFISIWMCTTKPHGQREEGQPKERAHLSFFVGQVWTNIEGNRANVVQTAWAVLSLIDAGQVNPSFSFLH